MCSDQMSPSMMSGSYTLRSQTSAVGGGMSGGGSAGGGRVTPGFPSSSIGQASPAALYTGHSRKGSFSSMGESTIAHVPHTAVALLNLLYSYVTHSSFNKTL